jgi:zinc/manganese transport system permease protein
MSAALSWIVEPGFFSNPTVHTAALVGGVVAFTSAVVGTFTVLRRQSFVGEALGDVGATGGSGAYLVGVNPLVGFVAAALAGAGIIQGIGTERQRGRDLATGIVLGGSLGLAALFLYLDANHTTTSGASVTVLFGSLFVLSPSVVPAVLALAAVVLVTVTLIYRPLLLTTVSPDLAAARGVPVRRVGATHLLAMALAVSLAALTIGAVLSTALLVGPPATALRLVKRPGLATLVAGAIGVATTWLGILVAYDSYDWPPRTHGWPVSFCIVAVVFLAYLAAWAVAARRERRMVRRLVAKVVSRSAGALDAAGR